ncbi:MAG TPA: substrate-binding domain-containing protein, partial [Armatimonadota bacterium]|nr:substrate-binding domain-containing protein [Armatimonadota bacterium]
AYATLQRWWGAPTQPTAVVALCDANASAMLRAAQLLGIAVPEQLSLIGFDNAAFCEHTMPRLTSIHQPMEDMGKLACRLLLERIAGDQRPVQHIQLGVDLIIRETVAPPCVPAAAEVVHC